MPNFQKLIERNKRIISDNLVSLITDDYILIDLPYHSNIGDSLIWLGEECFLKTLPYRCLYRASRLSFEYRELPRNVIILFHGGGNFGDIYEAHGEFRRRVMKMYPNNKIIILPQTVYYNRYIPIRGESQQYRNHKNTYILARDRYSYDFLKRYGFSDKVLMVPDMAFWIERSMLKTINIRQTEKILLFKRGDGEQTDLREIYKSIEKEQYEEKDWPLWRGYDPYLSTLNEYVENNKMDEANKFAKDIYMPSRIKTGVEFISSYKMVYSNRLHGAILSILLDKPVTIIDNSYGKNANFYDAWLKGWRDINIVRIRHKESIMRKIKLFITWVLTIKDRILYRKL